jgi:hypothetical protein
VNAVLWGAVAFFGLVFVVTLAGLAVLALRGWRQVKEVKSGLLASVEELTSSLSAVERRLGAIEARTGELQERIESLSIALARARVLLGAAREVGDVVGRVRGVVPKK